MSKKLACISSNMLLKIVSIFEIIESFDMSHDYLKNIFSQKKGSPKLCSQGFLRYIRLRKKYMVGFKIPLARGYEKNSICYKNPIQ